jgi:hypothetical protein
MRGRALLTPAGLLALVAALAAVDPATAVAVPGTLPASTAHAAAPTRAGAPRRPPAATAPRLTATPGLVHTPGDASAAGRRRLRADNSVDEGFLLGLPGAGPAGPTAYLPPEPRTRAGDAALPLLAAMAGLLATVGSGAVLLLVLVRPRPAPETPPARASVALSPAQTRRAGAPGRRRRPARLPREVFDRLPPLVQLAVLDHAGPPAVPGNEAGVAAPRAG